MDVNEESEIIKEIQIINLLQEIRDNLKIIIDKI
jgi:hypothetical protein